jgi:hypothetical protein
MVNGRIVGGTLRRKNGIRTLPVPARAETPALPPDDADIPAAKRPRLQAPSNIATAADGVVHAHTAESATTDSPDDTPTYSVTPVASLPSVATSRAPSHSWKPEEDAKLIEAIKKHGKKWVVVATLVPGRTNAQCHVVSVGSRLWILPLRRARVNGNQKKTQS